MTNTLIAHRSMGQGPPVVLLNGGLMTMMAWEPIAGPLSADHRVVECDFRGQLMSPGDPPATLEGHADDVVAVLDTLGIGAAHVVGTSFGALVGVVLAARRPERVRSLVAATATDRITDDDWIAAQPVIEACRAAAEGRGDGGRVLDLLVPTTFSDRYREANRATLETRRNQVAMLPPRYFAGFCGLCSVIERLDLAPHAARIRCPALVLAGGDDRTFPVERSRALAEAIPGAMLQIVPGAPHGMVVEQPEVVLTSIRAFFSRVEVRVS